MTTFTITDCSNDSQLQEFIKYATDGDTIIFACSGTITLTSTLAIKWKGLSAAGLTLDGNGNVVVLDGGKQMGVFLVEDMPLLLKGLTIVNGKAERGGGLFSARGKITITYCTFSGNEASESGGGLCNKEGEVRIGQCTFSGNMALHGGGLANEGRADIMNCTISGNTARGWGGGFSNSFGTNTGITSSTIVNNTASVAGGLHTGYPPLCMSATIVANNAAKHNPKQNGCRDVISSGYNLESSDDCLYAFTRTDQHNIDPALDPTGLQNNGGPTQTVALQAGSPAIGAVTEEVYCQDIDQRGWLRPPGITSCDVGAYQSSYLAPPAPPSP